MKQRKSFLLRIDPALHEALEAWAEQKLKEAVARRRNAQPSQEPHLGQTPPEESG
jgi:hypothetical protein